MKIQCRTLFDCTATGITGHYRAMQAPFRDKAGRMISNEAEWNFSRNQQRNWETILQMISLRTQPMNISATSEHNKTWQFTFEVEASGVYSVNADIHNMDALLKECNGIPMITNLTEQTGIDPALISFGDKKNIWFESVNNA